MKNLVVLICIMFMLPACKTPTAFKKIEPMAGVGLSGVKNGGSWKNKTGGIIGAETAIHKLNKKSTLNLGLNVSFQGADYSESYGIEPYDYFSLKSATGEGTNFSGTVNLTYLNLPLLYKYQAESGFYAEAGLQPSLLLSAKDKVDGADSYDYKDAVKGFDLGLPVGAGYKINENLGVGIRGIYGLLNFNDSGSSDKDHNYLILGTVHYSFDLSK